MKNHRGIISGIFGAYYKIIPCDNLDTEYDARLRGKLRLQRTRTEYSQFRHLLMVGDLIEYDYEQNNEIAIKNLLDRKNVLMRSSEFEFQALGSNLDRATLIQSLVSPELKRNFLDRFLASCHAGGVNPLLVFTKPDLAKEINSPSLQVPNIYSQLGYSVYTLNLLSEHETQALRDFKIACEKGVTLFAGNSGTGKSTIINKLFGQNIQKTSGISDSTGKGKHTTTNSRLFVSENHAAMYIDSPGVKEWGISHMSREEVISSFPELRPYLSQCKFKNCDHGEKESGCRIREVIHQSTENPESGIISQERLKSLYAMLDSLQYSERIRTGDYIKSTGRIKSGKVTKRKY